MKWTMFLAVSLLSTGTALGEPLDAEAPEPISLEAFVAIPRPKPTAELSYGAAHAQGIDLFLPAGDGPFPVAILVHGGCWRNLPGAGREQLRHLGAELANRGIAVWNIGYRRADEEGGGYPGTFQDVGQAIDRLRSEAARYRLDLMRTVLVGHSAGGHLALWAASRAALPEGSRIGRPDPFTPGAVISLAGVGDLRGFARLVPALCGPGIFERLTGLDSLQEGDLSEVSPAEMAPPAMPVVLVSGILDRLVPPFAADDYARAVRQRTAASVELLDIPGAGHFDLVTPGTSAWASVQRAIENTLNLDQPSPGN